MGVPNDNYGFNLGSFKCHVIRDGTIMVPGETGHTMELSCLLVRTGKHAILIDTGVGIGGQPDAGKLLQNLHTEGINRADIDMIILSHGHGDHIGGTTDANGRLVWPDAHYYMSKDEWSFWTSDPTLAHLHVEESVRLMFRANVRKCLTPIKNQLVLIDNEKGIMPGIKMLNAPGHTPGNIVVAISAGTDRLLYMGDVFHDTQQLGQPCLRDVFDFDHELAIRTRLRILSQVATTTDLVFASHFPFPGLGHIVAKGSAWTWQPVETWNKERG